MKIIVKTKYAGVQLEDNSTCASKDTIDFLVRKVKSLTKEAKLKDKPKPKDGT